MVDFKTSMSQIRPIPRHLADRGSLPEDSIDRRHRFTGHRVVDRSTNTGLIAGLATSCGSSPTKTRSIVSKRGSPPNVRPLPRRIASGRYRESRSGLRRPLRGSPECARPVAQMCRPRRLPQTPTPPGSRPTAAPLAGARAMSAQSPVCLNCGSALLPQEPATEVLITRCSLNVMSFTQEVIRMSEPSSSSGASGSPFREDQRPLPDWISATSLFPRLSSFRGWLRR
jgi:hypothetical protein